MRVAEFNVLTENFKLQASSLPPYVLLLIALSRCKFHTYFHYMPFCNSLQPSLKIGMNTGDAHCSSTPKTSAVSLIFYFMILTKTMRSFHPLLGPLQRDNPML